ncbi:hypothetical protein ABW16_01930 [Mycolicibacter heraklionensis]|uniref:DUF2613 domain-containing protein n=2 Tax=Mycolicibacter heraklionensis TaxID=512402 RepID=A0ABR5FKP3_9MYCO|nr:hypothetical protein ABW16_01930 [Mycolicibacter heraklionensis]
MPPPPHTKLIEKIALAVTGAAALLILSYALSGLIARADTAAEQPGRATCSTVDVRELAA